MRFRKIFDIMSNLSGGIDSTYCTYMWLRENPDKRMLIHYSHIQKRSARLAINDFERTAVHRILQYFNDRGLNNFEFVETSCNFLEAETHLNTMHILCFNTIAILNQSKYRCSKLMITASGTDMATSDYWKRAQKRNQVYQIYLPRLELVLPIEHLDRSDVIRLLPKDLLELCYFCQAKKAKETPCGKCRTCRQTLPFITS